MLLSKKTRNLKHEVLAAYLKPYYCNLFAGCLTLRGAYSFGRLTTKATRDDLSAVVLCTFVIVLTFPKYPLTEPVAKNYCDY